MQLGVRRRLRAGMAERGRHQAKDGALAGPAPGAPPLADRDVAPGGHGRLQTEDQRQHQSTLRAAATISASEPSPRWTSITVAAKSSA